MNEWREQMCEECGERPGCDNSQFIKEEGDDEGVWICELCEQHAWEEQEAWAQELASVYGGKTP